MYEKFQALSQLQHDRAQRYRKVSPLRRIYQDVLAKGGTLGAPLVVMLDLTTKCNANCSFCYRSGPATLMPRGEARYLPMKRLDSLCTQFKEMGVASITLSGGEPTCHPHFIDAVKRVKQWDFSVTVVTNGTSLAEGDLRALSGVLDPCRDRFELSFNAARAETFKKVVRSNRFEAFLGTLRGFQAYGIPFVTMTLILQDNYREIEQIVDLASLHGADECAVEAPFPKNHMDSRLYVSLERVFDIYAKLLQREQREPFIELNFFHLLEHLRQQKLLGGQPVELSHGCHAGEASCAIDINGNVHLCQFVIDSEATQLGNVGGKPFAAIWTDAQAKKQQLLQQAERLGGCPAFDWEAARESGQPQPIEHKLISA